MRCAVFAAVAVAALAAWPGPARGEVISLDGGGFAVAHAADSDAAPGRVYRAIVEDVARWWDGEHSWSGVAANLYIDARPGGCFCEKLPDGGGVEHLRIVYLAPAREIRLVGALGPLQTMGLQGTKVWQIMPADTGSRLEWTYTVHGHLAGGFEGIATAVDRVVGEQLERLAAWLESESADVPELGSG